MIASLLLYLILSVNLQRTVVLDDGRLLPASRWARAPDGAGEFARRREVAPRLPALRIENRPL